MGYADVGLPILLLGLAFILKLFVERSTTAPILVQSLLELPVDIIFLAMSFITAFTLSPNGKTDEGLFTLLLYVFIAVVLVGCSRKSITLFENDRFVSVFFISLVTYSFAIVCAFHSITLLKVLSR